MQNMHTGEGTGKRNGAVVIMSAGVENMFSGVERIATPNRLSTGEIQVFSPFVVWHWHGMKIASSRHPARVTYYRLREPKTRLDSLALAESC